MTDKEQIIIDGVDVSVCILRRRKEPNCTVCNAYSSKVFEFDCSDFKNCYFKQLARKTQEYEELKEVNSRLLQRLEVDDLDTGIVYRQELELQYKENEFYMAVKNLTRYRKALEEIENFMNYEFSGQNEWVKTRVLDIINKAKGEE